METEKSNTKQEQSKQNDTDKNTGKTSAWEKAATEMAGDNQLLASLLKLLISPFTLIAGLGIIIYLFITNNNLKKEVEKLKEENKKLTEENEELTEESKGTFIKYRKLKQFLEAEQRHIEQISLKQKPLLAENKPKLRTTYLK